MIINNTIVKDRRETLFCVDTGKVRIGCAYVPPPMEMLDEELIIQKAMLPKAKRLPWSKDAVLGVFMFLCFIATLIIYIYE